ncbi:hypothetical protein B0I35DRAFT_485302 [Stachybotrys elegans]|uniref:DUF7770 domain-containing protein n=1 Tax=Stachybotrys elegans TaxID=80388 RepID=A0A8K0WJC5_9HYPO|nr:hypothetical protein B0I35DRAFT_485302 [Stachybotrys elegans]
MSNLDPFNYIPESEKADIRKRSVYFAHFVAYSALENGGNHWDIFLQTAKNESVRIDMTPGAYPGSEGYLGRLDVASDRWGATCRGHKILTIPMDRRHSVASFLDAITQADNHRYEFTREGRGCGGWIRDQFYLFVGAGLLPSGWEPTFESTITVFWENEAPRSPWPVTHGTYLKDRKRTKGKQKRRQQAQ